MAETPAFRLVQHSVGDNWGSLANAWNNKFQYSKNSQIQVIQEEIDFEHYGVKKNDSLLHIQQVQSQKKSSKQSLVQAILFEEEPQSFQIQTKIPQSSKKPVLQSNIMQKNMIEKQNKNNDQNQKYQLANSQYSDKSVVKKRILNSNMNENTQVRQSPRKNRAIIEQRIPSSSLIFQSPSKKYQQTKQKMSLFNKNSFSYPFNDDQNHEKCSNTDGQNQIEVIEQSFDNKSKVLARITNHKPTKKQTQILSEIYRRQPEKFQQALLKSVNMVISQNQASLFFAEHIRIFNPQLTKDRLLRLYRQIDDTQQNRIQMTKSLRQFKLQQVPSACLIFNSNIIEIFRVIYPQVYIEDLLNPSATLYQSFVQSYFNKKFISKFSIRVEDEKIDLSHPRNLLNILLYLNQSFHLPNQIVFQIYTKKMIKHDQTAVIKKITQSNIPSICQIDASVFEKAAQTVAREILQEKCIDYNRIQDIIQFMDSKNKRFYTHIINIIEDFTLTGINFDINAIIKLPQSKNTYEILKDIIDTNCASTLVKLNLPQVLIMLSRLQNGKAQGHYTLESIEITKYLANKLIEMKYVVEGISALMPIAVVLNRSYLASLLINNFKGRFLNRLANFRITNIQDFMHIFQQLLTTKNNSDLRDNQPKFVQKYQKLMQWSSFKQLCQQILHTKSWEICYLIYTDIGLAYQLTEQSIITQSQFQQLCRKLGYQPNRYKYMKSLSRRPEQLKIPLGSQTNQSNHSEQMRETLNYGSSRKNKKIFDMSFKFSKRVDSKDLQQGKHCRSFIQNSQETDPILFDIKFQVVPEESLKLLRQYFQQSTSQQFLGALKLVDRQKLGIIVKNMENFKSIDSIKLNFPFKHIVPFQYFFDTEKAWNLIQNYIKSQLNYSNFWTFFILVQILYSGKTTSIVTTLIRKLIFYVKDDIWADAIKDILNQVKLSKQFLIEAANAASDNGLFEISQTLMNKISI